MTAQFDIDRRLSDWLQAERPSVAPEHILERVRSETLTTPRRAGWRIADRWTWRRGAAIRATARVLVVVAVIASLVALTIVGASLLGPRKPAPPFGLTSAGLIAVDTKDGIVVTRTDGSGRSLITNGDGVDVSPTWSRDGLHLAFWHRDASAARWTLVVIDADGANRAVLADGVRLRAREDILNQPSNLSWSPDSQQIAYAADVDAGSSIFIATLGKTGATQITDPALKALDPAWSPRGEVIAFQSDASATLHVVGVDGAGEHRLSSLTQTAWWPDWAPDGSRLAVAAANGGSTDIWTVSADGAELHDISNDPNLEISPSWSPDGERVAWARALEGPSSRAWIAVADLAAPTVIEIHVEVDFAPPVWSPDGLRLFSYAPATGGRFKELLVLDPSGVAPVIRLPADGNVGNGNWQRLP